LGPLETVNLDHYTFFGRIYILHNANNNSRTNDSGNTALQDLLGSGDHNKRIILMVPACFEGVVIE
jgi:hypothetical protein